MTTQEREAIYEHCARLAEAYADCSHDLAVVAKMTDLAKRIREHAQDPVRFP